MMTRRHFSTSDATDFLPHDHVLWCGEGPTELHRVAVSAFSAAAPRGERMFFISDQPRTQQLAALSDLESFTTLVENGSLQVLTVGDTYYDLFDPDAQRAHFEQALEEALSEGHTGICVVADNSPLAGGSDEEFGAWLAWEATADAIQARKPVTGVCYLDRHAVNAQRMSDISAMHPVLSTGVEEPNFRIYVDQESVRVIGELDYWCAEQLRRILLSYPKASELVLDLSELSFIDHRALLVMDHVARRGHDLRVRGARPIVHRLWEHLGLEKAQLETC